MNFYIIYDNLYEEFQQPFCIKNDTVAKEEFLAFKNGLIEKAKDEKEKNKINTRYFLYKFNDIKYKKTDNTADISFKNEIIFAEPIEWGNEGEEDNE